MPVPYGRGFRLLFCLCAAAAAGVKFGCASLAIRLFFRGLPLLRDGVACDDGHQILGLVARVSWTVGIRLLRLLFQPGNAGEFRRF